MTGAPDTDGGGHIPVLLREVVAALAPRPGALILDATFGGGGYARAILEAADCKLIAIDRDPAAIVRAQALESLFPGRIEAIEGRFGELDTLVGEPLDGVVFDLGVSSFQLDEAARGFSFRFDAPLDMRMGAGGPTAAEAVNHLPEAALADVIYHYGEEPQARRIARALCQARLEAPIGATGRLAALVERATGGRRGAKIHPATKTFQALRVLVNDELGELARGLAAAERRLRAGGMLVTVAFHSLEDRMVKAFLTERSGGAGAGSRHAPQAAPLAAPSFEKPMKAAPGVGEIAANPRARSARLRAARRTDAAPWPALDAPGLPAATADAWARLVAAS